MASARQIAANRRNAQRSTGPRTQAGKARARANAFTHGLTARMLRPLAWDEHDKDLLVALAGPSPSEAVREAARAIAWQETCLRRCRQAQDELLGDLLRQDTLQTESQADAPRDGSEVCPSSAILQRYTRYDRYGRRALRARTRSLLDLAAMRAEAGTLGDQTCGVQTDQEREEPGRRVLAETASVPPAAPSEPGSGCLSPAEPIRTPGARGPVARSLSKRSQSAPPSGADVTTTACQTAPAKRSQPAPSPTPISRAHDPTQPDHQGRSPAQSVAHAPHSQDPSPVRCGAGHRQPAAQPVPPLTARADLTSNRRTSQEDQTKRSQSAPSSEAHVTTAARRTALAKRSQSPLVPPGLGHTPPDREDDLGPCRQSQTSDVDPAKRSQTQDEPRVGALRYTPAGSPVQNEADPRPAMPHGRGTLDDPLIRSAPLIENRFATIPQFRIGPPRR